MQDIRKGEQYRTKKLQHILKQAHNIMKINESKQWIIITGLKET